eukprot:TRINITY_DN24635_c0_g1_i1.p1 TRINITY_DN24635_c0_g1~~TRINITY_DN24635_c0_g1_i1.p1  ORF type:complete len:149 (-),score=29.61 TRINITY_DN24635_c0_g1_i1:56-502(-)
MSPMSIPWSIVNGNDEDGWLSWESLGKQLKDKKYNIEWKRCSDMRIGWSGLVKFKPGQELPLHIHNPPEIYYILKGSPILKLGDEKIRSKPMDCVTIPSNCPHGLVNDTDQEVLLLYSYQEVGGNTSLPGPNYGWKFLEPIEWKTDDN